MAVNIPENKNRNDYFKVFGLLDHRASIEALKTNIVKLHGIINKYWEPGNHSNEKAESLYRELVDFYLHAFYSSVLQSCNEREVPATVNINEDIAIYKMLEDYVLFSKRPDLQADIIEAKEVTFNVEDLLKAVEDNKKYAVQKAKDLTKAALDYMAGIDGNFEEPEFGSVKDEDIGEFNPTLIKDYISVVHRRYVEAAPYIISVHNGKEKLFQDRFTEIYKGETKEFVDKNGNKKSISL